METALESQGFVALGRIRAPAPEKSGHFLLIGNAGPAMWATFQAERLDPDDTLDRWVNEVLSRVASDFGVTCLFPNDGPPWHPFQQWGLGAGDIFSSPLGIQIHAKFGLWFAYRAAFHMPEELAQQETTLTSPCTTCRDQPCRSACPVSAIGNGPYDVPACIEYIDHNESQDCLDLGCRARRACPEGREFTYEPAQAKFHMKAFLAANRE